MALSTAEVESLRFHLGYGNMSVSGHPYTSDGFYEIFTQIISPNLSTSTETTSTTSVSAAGITTITLGSVTLITPYTRLIVDVGDAAETVVVRAVSGSTITATFAKAHTQPYPVAVLSGVSRLRQLLHSADTAWATLQSADITGSAGIKQLGQGEIEWFAPSAVYLSVLRHYTGICEEISKLVCVPLAGSSEGGSSMAMY